MYRIKIFTIGKIKESWLEEALDEYTQRLKNHLVIEWILAKDLVELERRVEKEPYVLCLDPQGELLTSESFSKSLMQHLSASGSRLCFVIGGAEGVSQKIRIKAKTTLSLSLLTFTHQMTRLILLEQIYRAFEIDKGSPYHKV